MAIPVGPLLKWPGGKTRELGELRSRLPASYSVYVEPFVGGGAGLFALEFDRAFVNDANEDLVDLYRRVQAGDPDLETTLRAMARVWDHALPVVATELAPLVAWYEASGREQGALPPPALVSKLATFDAPSGVKKEAEIRLRDKLRRLHRLEIKNETRFDAALLTRQLETAQRAGYYTWVRDAWEPNTRVEKTAAFFFLREFCYGSMFRQNKAGRFNIPYGGMGYNAKNFGRKLDRLYASDRMATLSRTEVHGRDFRAFFDEVGGHLDEQAVVFLDPPYDSEFKEYAGRTFGDAEQAALATIVGGLGCHVVGLVKATPRIRELYQKAAATWKARGVTLHLAEYGKKYGYNVRGRNQRNVSHLAFWGGPGA